MLVVVVGGGGGLVRAAATGVAEVRRGGRAGETEPAAGRTVAVVGTSVGYWLRRINVIVQFYTEVRKAGQRVILPCVQKHESPVGASLCLFTCLRDRSGNGGSQWKVWHEA